MFSTVSRNHCFSLQGPGHLRNAKRLLNSPCKPLSVPKKTAQFNNVPPQALKPPVPFTLHIPADRVEKFTSLLELSEIGPLTWENSSNGNVVTREWLAEAKELWLRRFNWREEERLINKFPNFKTEVEHPVHCTLSIHFMALFSANPDAIPIVFLHGWPGSFLEFMPMLEILTDKYDSQTLPYHIVIPSLPGYTLSSGPPLERDFSNADAACLMNQLMVDLGFRKNGYIAQGGDIGSDLARRMTNLYPECRAVHCRLAAKKGARDVPSDFNNNGRLMIGRGRSSI